MTTHRLIPPHRPVYSPDYSMLLGCRCGQKFQPSDCDDEYAAHLAELIKAPI